MMTLREFLTEFCVDHGWDTSEEGLLECFEESFDCVYYGDRDEHRWYDCLTTVTKVTINLEDRYFKSFTYEMRGECDSPEDAGLDMPEIDSIREVYPHKTTTIIYKATKQEVEL